MFFGMMEAERWYNTGQTNDYLKYAWIFPELEGFILILDFGFGFLLMNERPDEPVRVRFSEGGNRHYEERQHIPPIWKIIAFRSNEANIYEFPEDEKEDAVHGVYNFLMHAGGQGWAFNRAMSMLRNVLRCEPEPADDVTNYLMKQIQLQQVALIE